MRLRKLHVLFGLVALAALSLPAADGNLLRNPTLVENPSSPGDFPSWELSAPQGVRREVIEAFQGMPDSMCHWTGKGTALIRQRNIAVKPNTWYVVSGCYRNLSGKEAGPPPFNLCLGVAEPKAGKWGSFRHRGFGSSDSWIEPRLLFNSGARREVDLIAMLHGEGEWGLGRLSLRELEERDFRSACVADGDFELGLLGGLPLDFKPGGEPPGNLCVEANEGFPAGSKNMVGILAPGRPLALAGPELMARNGDMVKMSIWAKAEKPGAELSLALLTDTGEWQRTAVALTDKWRKVELTAAAPPQEELLRASVKASDKTGNVVRFDRFALEAVPPGESKAARPEVKNLLLMNSSFEAGPAGWEWMFFEPSRTHRDGGRVAIDMGDAAEGACSLKIDVPEAPGAEFPEYHLLLRSACFEAPALAPYTVSFWARADREGAPCKVEMFYGGGATIRVGTTWKRHQTTIMPTQDKQGKNHLYFKFPMNGRRYWLDAVQVEKGEAMTAYEPSGQVEVGGDFTSEVYPVFTVGDEVAADVYCCSRLTTEREFKLGWEVTDYQGQAVATGSRAVTAPPGKTVRVAAPLPGGLAGHFSVKLKLENASGAAAENWLIYAVLFPPRTVDANKSWFGVLPGSLNCGRGGKPQAYLCLKGGTYDQQMKLLRRCGFNWIRTFAPGDWANSEREKGKFDWAFDSPVKAIHDNGLKLYTYLGAYNDYPGWSDSGIPFKNGELKVKGRDNYPRLSDWRDYARAFAAHYKGKVDAVTIMNETGGYGAAEYFELLKELHPILKSGAPGTLVCAPGYPCQSLPYGADDDTWIGKLMKMGAYDYLDVFDGHFYIAGHAHGLNRVRKEPFESALDSQFGTKVETLAKQMAYYHKTYGDKPVWNTESGVIFTASAPWMEIPPQHLRYDWYSPELSAALAVKWGVVQMAMGVKRQMYFMFNLPFMHAYHCLDIVNYDMSPRVGLPALAQFARRLDLAEFKEFVKIRPDTWAYVFEVEGETVVAYWDFSLENRGRAKLELDSSPDSLLVEDIMGNQQKITRDGEHAVLPLACSPMYFVSSTLRAGEMAALLRGTKVLGGVDCELAVTPGDLDAKAAVVVGVRNLSTSTLRNVQLRLELPPGWAADSNTVTLDAVEPLKTRTAGVRLSALSNAPSASIGISGMIGDRIYTASSRNLSLAKFPRAKAPANVDGMIEGSEYAKEAALSLDQASQALGNAWPPLGEPPVKGKLWAAWTPTSLRFAVEVKDADVVNNASQGQLYAGDCVELYLDFAPGSDPFSGGKYDGHQVKLVFAPANGEFPARMQAEAMGQLLDSFADIPLKEIKLASRKTASGYNLEVEIPVVKTQLTPGRLLGFNVQLVGQGKTAGNRCALMWNGKSSWNNTGNFGFASLDE